MGADWYKGQVDQSVFLFLCLCHCVLVHLQTAPWWWEHNIFLIAILHKTCFTLQAKEWKGQRSYSRYNPVWWNEFQWHFFCKVPSRYFWLLFFLSMTSCPPISPHSSPTLTKIFPGYSLEATPKVQILRKWKRNSKREREKIQKHFPLRTSARRLVCPAPDTKVLDSVKWMNV